jgi:hypothetical protein
MTVFFFLPLALIIVVYLLDVGLAPSQRDDQDRERQLSLPLK